MAEEIQPIDPALDLTFLVTTTSGDVIDGDLSDGETLDLSDLSDELIFEVQLPDGSDPGSFLIEIFEAGNPVPVDSRVENAIPFRTFINQDILPSGDYTIQATIFDGPSLSGNQLGDPQTINFTVDQEGGTSTGADTDFNFLVSTLDGELLDGDFQNGDVLDLTDVTSQVIFEVALPDGSDPGAFLVELFEVGNPNPIITDVESISTFTLDTDLDLLPPGDYFFQATLFDGEDPTSNQIGDPQTVSFSVVNDNFDAVDATVQDLDLIFSVADENGDVLDANFENGDTLDLTGVAGQVIFDVALPDGSDPGSFLIELFAAGNPNPVLTDVESIGPFTLDTDLALLPPGDYVLQTTAFVSESPSSLQIGDPQTISFSVVNDDVAPVDPALDLTFSVTTTNDDVIDGDLNNGEILDLSDLDGGIFFEVELPDGSDPGSFLIEIFEAGNPDPIDSAIQNLAPFRNFISQDLLPSGDYVVQATIFDGPSLSGNQLGDPQTINFTVDQEGGASTGPDTDFNFLVSTLDGELLDGDFQNGDVLDLTDVTSQVIFEVALSDGSDPGAFLVELFEVGNPNPIITDVESISTFTLDTDLDLLPPGDYFFQATLFDGEDPTSNQIGDPQTVSFSVVNDNFDAVDATAQDLDLIFSVADENGNVLDANFESGDTLDLTGVAGQVIFDVALPDGSDPGSFLIELFEAGNPNPVLTDVESIGPFTLDTDLSLLPPGDYVLQTTAFVSESPSSLQIGDPQTISFSVVNDDIAPVDPTDDGITVQLINADTDQVVAEIEDGQTISLSPADLSASLSIVVLVDDATSGFGQPESVVFNLNDGQTTRTESFEPFALFGDNGSAGDIFGGDIPIGTQNTLTLDFFAANGGSGEMLSQLNVSFTIAEEGDGVDPTPPVGEEEDPAEGSTLIINAFGDEGTENFDVEIDGVVVATFEAIGTEPVALSVELDQQVTAEQVRLVFTNNEFNPFLGINSNLNVTSIELDGQTFETTDPSTFVSDAFVPGEGITSGFGISSEVVITGGFFQFDDPTTPEQPDLSAFIDADLNV